MSIITLGKKIDNIEEEIKDCEQKLENPQRIVLFLSFYIFINLILRFCSPYWSSFILSTQVLDKDKDYFQKKEVSLRKKEESLRKKEESLREYLQNEKKDLRKKEEYLQKKRDDLQASQIKKVTYGIISYSSSKY